MSKAVHLNILETSRFHTTRTRFLKFFAYSKKYTPRTKLCFAFLTRKIKRLFFIEGG